MERTGPQGKEEGESPMSWPCGYGGPGCCFGIEEPEKVTLRI